MLVVDSVLVDLVDMVVGDVVVVLLGLVAVFVMKVGGLGILDTFTVAITIYSNIRWGLHILYVTLARHQFISPLLSSE